MVDELKKTVFKLIDKAFTQNGRVTGIRKWTPASIYEIDLHLPDTDMEKWVTIPRLKIKVAEPGHYRDYSPSTWDSKKRTCTILVETAHQGQGSGWVKTLRAGDSIVFASAHAASLPSRPGKIVCFGDGSAIGHFMALNQLTDRSKYPLQAVVFVSENYKLPEYVSRNFSHFEFIIKSDINNLQSLPAFTEKINWTNVESIYLAGQIPMVSELKRIFKSAPQISARIFANVFWR